ncbi:uncharacterized protein BROUX77_006322 [Berkeleyomyces rouxiae]|uniref:uncharacterized protein n=1 Tax=Berkeleyomyces rouxiae TaxID=2035830 RepID=UPI003B798A4C
MLPTIAPGEEPSGSFAIWAQTLFAQVAEQTEKAEQRQQKALERADQRQKEALDQMAKTFRDSQEAAWKHKIPKAPAYSVQKLKLDAAIGEVEHWLVGIQEVNAAMAPDQPDRFYVVWAVAPMHTTLQNSWRGHSKAKGLVNPTFKQLASFLRKEHASPRQRIKETIDALKALTPKEDEDPLTFHTAYQNYVSLLGPTYAPTGNYEVYCFLNRFPNWLQREFMKVEDHKMGTVEEVAYTLS